MRYLAVLLAVLMLGTIAYAQTNSGRDAEVFIPLSLSTTGVGQLSARAMTLTYADTTKPISVRGYEHVYLVLKETASDTANVHIYFRGSVDGVTWTTGTTADAWTYIDSVNWKPTTNDALFQKCFELPSTAMGFNSVEFKVHCPGTVTLGAGTGASASAPKLTYYIVRKFKK
jgi:hypothetical protein